MKAVWNNTVIAEAQKEDLIKIEGNWYFPPSALKRDYFSETDHHTTCMWKGEASYYDVAVDGEVSKQGAWYYAQPLPGSVDRVRKNFANYVAFWNGIEISE